MKGGDDEGGADSHAITVVEKALEIFSLVSGVIKTSTRAGGHVCISDSFHFVVNVRHLYVMPRYFALSFLGTKFNSEFVMIWRIWEPVCIQLPILI